MADPTLDAFIRTLVPQAYDKTEVSSRRAAVEKALRNSSLAVTRMFESGSWSHGTSIASKSDVDYMAVATGNRPMRPSTALTNARLAIASADWRITGTSVSSPIVAVSYLKPPNFEIAPAWFEQRIKGYDVYSIGGRGDEWVQSAPQAHLDYVNQQNDRLNGRVKQLIRLIKAWKHQVGAPVSSFYLEMRAAEYASRESIIILDVDLRSMVAALINSEIRDMNDPKGIVGRIPACASDEKRSAVRRLAQEAWNNLEIAYRAKDRNDRNAYWLAMRQVFGGGFPWPAW